MARVCIENDSPKLTIVNTFLELGPAKEAAPQPPRDFRHRCLHHRHRKQTNPCHNKHSRTNSASSGMCSGQSLQEASLEVMARGALPTTHRASYPDPAAGTQLQRGHKTRNKKSEPGRNMTDKMKRL